MTSEQYHELIIPYEDAKNIVLTRLEILNHSVYSNTSDHAIHHIQHRTKKKSSIEKKLDKLEQEDTFSNAKEYLMDIAGVRTVCYFEQDVYKLVELIKKQSDLIIIKEKDYIRYPKENGYRSYHMVIGVQVCTMDSMDYYPVEVQFRTLTMDFWASMEHRICYKKNRENEEELATQLKEYSDVLEFIEKSLQIMESPQV